MSPAFIRGTADYLPNANITFDKFHVIQALNKVQDEVRRTEQRENPLLKKSRYLWLRNPDKLSEKQEAQLAELQTTKLKTAKVYQMKLVFQEIYREIKDSEQAELAIKKWLFWAVRSRIEPVKEFAKMVKKHFDGIMRYWTSRLTSGTMESINSRIQNLKRRARGFQNVDNFISMIYLEMSNLEFDLPT
jgi:transposase